MNTPAHLILGTAAFGRATRPGSFWAAFAGSLAPDLSLYLMAGWAIYVRGIPANRVFDELYFSDAWQSVFAIDNSFVLWAIVLAVAVACARPWLTVFSAAGLLHLACDFALHNEDARRQFWPVSDWVFRSPVSYWDPRRHGDLVGGLEMAMVAVLTVVLWRRFRGKAVRATIAAAAALELVPGLMFHFLLHGG